MLETMPPALLERLRQEMSDDEIRALEPELHDGFEEFRAGMLEIQELLRAARARRQLLAGDVVSC